MTPVAEQTPAKTAPAKGVQVTEKALAKIRTAIVKEGISPEQGGLRLGVQGGGCSGLSYNIRFDTQPRERDRIYQFGDVRVFVDPKSFIYLHGMILDYQETLMQQGFVFVNPKRRSRAVAARRSQGNLCGAGALAREPGAATPSALRFLRFSFPGRSKP